MDRVSHRYRAPPHAHRLQKVDDRIHILEGRQLVLLSIDKVIKLIRNSDEPKPDLIKAFKLSERQADDILELRLRQLATARRHSASNRSSPSCAKSNRRCSKLLGSDAALRKLVGKEIEEDAKKYGDKIRAER